MKPAALRPELLLEPVAPAGVLLPLPLTGAYDYKLPRGVNATRGLLVGDFHGMEQLIQSALINVGFDHVRFHVSYAAYTCLHM